VLSGADIEIANNQFFVGTAAGSQGIQTWKDDSAPAGIQNVARLWIHGNTFADNGACAGSATNLYDAIVINTQSDAVGGGDVVTVEDNAFSGRVRTALTTERAYVLFEHNAVATVATQVAAGVLPRGVYLQAVNLTLASNSINGFEAGVHVGPNVLLGSDSDVNLTNNCITGNVIAARFDGDAATFSVGAHNNWWGDAAGPVACPGTNCVQPEFDASNWLSADPGWCP